MNPAPSGYLDTSVGALQTTTTMPESNNLEPGQIGSGVLVIGAVILAATLPIAQGAYRHFRSKSS